ncbi:hypothetical protein BJX99DRAFT_31233 [Aspergillus californicus]
MMLRLLSNPQTSPGWAKTLRLLPAHPLLSRASFQSSPGSYFQTCPLLHRIHRHWCVYYRQYPWSTSDCHLGIFPTTPILVFGLLSLIELLPHWFRVLLPCHSAVWPACVHLVSFSFYPCSLL